MTTPTPTPALLSLRTRKTCLTSSLGEHLGQVSLSPGPYPTLQQYPGPHQPRQSFAPHAVQATAAPPGHRGCVLRPPLALPARDAETARPSHPLGSLPRLPRSLSSSSLQLPPLPAPPPGPGLPRAPWGLSALPPARPSLPPRAVFVAATRPTEPFSDPGKQGGEAGWLRGSHGGSGAEAAAPGSGGRPGRAVRRLLPAGQVGSRLRCAAVPRPRHVTGAGCLG